MEVKIKLEETINRRMILSKTDYYETHLLFVNCILPSNLRLTPMEMKVLAAFMGLEGDIAEYRFGASAKKVVMKKLSLSVTSLANHLASLIAKDAIVKDGDQTHILPMLIPHNGEQTYLFKLIKNKENEQH